MLFVLFVFFQTKSWVCNRTVQQTDFGEGQDSEQTQDSLHKRPRTESHCISPTDMKSIYPFRSVLKATLFTVVTIAILTVNLMGVSASVQAQDLDLLIKNGHVIDPKNDRHEVMDVGVTGDTVATVASNISASRAEAVVNASGLYVTPGLIDLHTHVFHGTRPHSSVKADAFTFRSGVTTAVDVGSAGWRNFRQFMEQTVEHSKTRILAFINIVGAGMQGGVIEQNLMDMNPRLTAMTAERYSDTIVGVKLAHIRGRTDP